MVALGMNRTLLLAALICVGCVAAPSPRTAPKTTVQLDPAPQAEPPKSSGAVGEVRVDLLDEYGGVLGPVLDSGMDRCHRGGSQSIGWAVYRKNYQTKFRLHESDGISPPTLACIERALSRMPDRTESGPLVLYVRLF